MSLLKKRSSYFGSQPGNPKYLKSNNAMSSMAMSSYSRRYTGGGKFGGFPRYRRKYFGKKRCFNGLNQSGGAVNTITYSGRSWNRPRYLPPNKKYVEQLLNVTFAGAGALTCINLVAEGTDITNRIGKRIYVQSVELVLIGSATNNAWAKVSLVMDMQPNGATTTYGDIFDTDTASSVMALRNMNTAYRYRVLKNQQLVSNGSASIDTTQMTWHIPCGFWTDFSGTDATIDSMNTNALYLAYGANADGIFAVTMNVRVHFSDS